MGNEKYLFPNNGHEDEVPQPAEEKAAEEKASRRHWYICARVAADNLARYIQRIESGASSQANSLEALREQLANTSKMVAEFEDEFADDPNIERDIQREIQAAEDIARALGRKGAVDK